MTRKLQDPLDAYRVSRTPKNAIKPCPHPGVYHLGSDGLTVVRPHPQADSCFAREQGYVILKIEAWAREAGPAIVAALNAAGVKVGR
jgi:hypothetical protein